MSEAAALVSTLASDPGLRRLVEDFVADLPRRMAAIERAVAEANTGALKRLAHQLRGAAGGYGFAPITEAAATLERAAEAGADLSTLRSLCDVLASLCRRAAAGHPGSIHA